MVNDKKSRELIKKTFQSSYDLSEESKNLKTAAREARADLAVFLKVSTLSVNLAYSEWLKRENKPEVMHESDEIIEEVYSSQKES